MTFAIRRLQKELNDMKSEHETMSENISAGPVSNDNLLLWNATIIGAVGTPYEGGLFRLKISFPSNYPLVPPVVKFVTKVFHPNINENGDICLDILKHHWSAAYSVSHVLLSLSSLLSDPNPDDPLNTIAAKMYKTNRLAYDLSVRDYVIKYAN